MVTGPPMVPPKVVKAKLPVFNQFTLRIDRGKRIARVGSIISEEPVAIAMEGVGSGLENDAENPAAGSSVFRRETRGDGLEFRHGIGCGVDDHILREAGEIQTAVQIPSIGSALPAVHGDVRSEGVGGIGKGSELAVKAEVAARRAADVVDTGDEVGQLLQVAPLQRDFLNDGSIHRCADVGSGRIDKRRLRDDLDSLARGVHPELRIHTGSAAAANIDVAQVHGGKTRRLDLSPCTCPEPDRPRGSTPNHW